VWRALDAGDAEAREEIPPMGAIFLAARRAAAPGRGVTSHEAALIYLRHGYSVIPLRPHDKRPAIAWEEFQRRRATKAEVTGWYRRWPEAGVGIVCGSVSGIVVVDGDPRNGDGLGVLASYMPRTWTAETGGGGEHRYIFAPPWRLSKMTGLLPGLDLQAERGYVVAPPSRYPSGRPYRWRPDLALGEVPLAPVPSLIHDLIRLRRARETARPVTRRAVRAGALTLEGVLEQLDGVQRLGGQWVARCPAHDDQEASLSLAAGAGGRLLAYCHAGCTFDDIIHALLEGIPA